MAEFKCGKCDEKMHKKGIIQSGNSKYEVYLCNECGAEEMKAIGVNPDAISDDELKSFTMDDYIGRKMRLVIINETAEDNTERHKIA